MDKPQAAIQAIKGLIRQAELYSTAHWGHKSWNENKQELGKFGEAIDEKEKMLNEAIEHEDFAKQHQLEQQILHFKNQIDESRVIRQYLIQSKYTQLEHSKDENNASNLRVEQKTPKEVKNSRQKILEETMVHLTQVFEGKIKQEMKEAMKLLETEFDNEFKNQIGELEQQISQKGAEIGELMDKNKTLKEDFENKQTEMEQILEKANKDQNKLNEQKSKNLLLSNELDDNKVQIQGLTQKVFESDQFINKLNKEIDNVKEECKGEISKLECDNQTLGDILNETQTNLELKMDSKSHPTIQVLSKQSRSKFIKNLFIHKAPKEDDDLRQVMKNNLCDEIDSFTFNRSGEVIDLSYYFESVKLA